MKARVLALFLSALMVLLPILATGCSESKVNPDESAANTDSNTVTSPTDTEEAPEEMTAAKTIAARYADINYDGYTYSVLAIPTDGHFYTQVQDGINEVYAEEMNAELINDAIFQRNTQTEALLNIVINPVWGSSVDGIRSTVRADVMAGSTDYEAVLNRMDYMGTNMQNGDLLNIKNIATIDTSDYWWDKNIVDSFTMFGTKLYWISGDLNIFDDFAVEVIFFNKQLLSVSLSHDKRTLEGVHKMLSDLLNSWIQAANSLANTQVQMANDSPAISING